MPDPNQFYQAPLESPGYVNPGTVSVPKQPTDLYSLFSIVPSKSKLATRTKNPYELMMEGGDPLAQFIPDIAPIQTNLNTINPLNDAAGLFHSQDGFGKYGYSSILGGGDNEARYADNFQRDNPSLFRPGIKSAFYWGLGFLEKTLESAVVKTGQGFAGLYGLTIGNTIDQVTGKPVQSFDEWLTSASDNVFSNMFDSWDENLKNRYHYFQEKSDRDKKGFIASLSDGDFWMNDVSDGLGFLVSAAFEVGLISKLGLGTKVASRLSPLAKGVSTEALTAAQVGKTGLQRTMNFLGVESTGNALVKNAVDLTAQTLATTVIESAVEANEVKQKIYGSFEGRINPETGYYYTTEEKERLSAAGAAEVFKQNMTILIGPKFLETLVFNRIGKYAKGLLSKSAATAETAGGKASAAVRSKLGNLSSGTSYDKTSALKNIWKVGSVATLGFLSEGLFEENIQLAISRTANEKFGADDEFYRPGTSEENVNKLQKEDEIFGSVGKRYISQTKQFFKGAGDDRFVDDELSKSIGIGGLFGVGGGIIHASLGARQQAKVDKYWNDRLNAATTNLFESQHFYQTKVEERPDPSDPTKTKPVETILTDPKTGQPLLDQKKLQDFLNKMNNIQGIMDVIQNTEDPTDKNNSTYQNKELNKLARNVLFTQLAMEYIKAGKKDLLLANLTSSSNFSDKDIQALGYEPGNMKPGEKKEMLAKMTKIVERLSKSDTWIENNVLDNVSETREGYFGLKYSKAQKEKRSKEFEAKKAYLRGLAMQNALLDIYLDEITDSETALGEPSLEILSSILDENGIPVTDYSVPFASVSRNFNARIPALKNQIEVLQKEFAYHWDSMLSKERNSPKAQDFNNRSKANNGTLLGFNLLKTQETLEKINKLQSELDELTSQRDAFMNNNSAFELVGGEEDTNFYVQPKAPEKDNNALDLEALDNEKQRRINAIKREEIGIQKGWIEDEWKLTAALKEEKTKAERPETLLSRRMSLSYNAYNTYFQREVANKDNSLGQRKLKLFSKDPNKIVTTKKYKANEEKLLKAIRIQGKVQTILADINGQKLLAEISALLERDLSTNEFTSELKRITDNYNGKPIVIENKDKNLVDDQIDAVQEEYNFVASIFEFMPDDDRFNDKYYDIDQNGDFVVKPQYDSLQDLANIQRELKDRIDDLNKIKNFLNSIPETIPGDWNNVNTVKKRIADVYTETSDSIITAYNQSSNDGQSDISGDLFSTKQELDSVEEELDELEQLKTIFTDRNKTDMILATPEFNGFIEDVDKRIETLKKLKEIIKERLSSRLRENQDFLIDAVGGLVNQLGLSMSGEVENQSLSDIIKDTVSSQIYTKFVTSLQEFAKLLAKEDQTTEDKKAIVDLYWSVNGQVAAIQQLIRSGNKDKVIAEVEKQKRELISKLETTSLMQKLKSEVFYKEILENIDDSILGVLQLIFYNTGTQVPFTKVGAEGESTLDDQPGSPIYKFREDYNLRKLLRNVEKDESRTTENSNTSKEELMEFLPIMKSLQDLEDLHKSLGSTLNLLDQIEKEKEIVQAKINKKDNQYENLIISSIQQLFFIRNIASFLRRTTGGEGFKNWIYIQAPGGAGKTQTLGTWFNIISGIPRDKVIATAFTEEAARGIKKALIVGEEGPKNVEEVITFIQELIKNKQFDHDVLIVDEFPAIGIKTQKALFDAVSEYTKLKSAQNKGEFKVITMGDTNQLTFSDDGSVSPRPSIITNQNYFRESKTGVNQNHPAKMNIIPSLTVNFRSNIFAITSFIDQFKGSATDTVNASIKVTSSDKNLETKNTKGVVSINKSDFKSRLIGYLKLNTDSTRTKAIIVNESKIEEYKKLLTDNGIKIITDPNDEVTKGVYVTTVTNSQGFSFDEVFIDLENNDKTLFSGTASLNFIYNKAMYVATSRARNLIVVSNFPNFENIEDTSIDSLENKALEELQTKDTEFISNRDSEIAGAKTIMGEEYAKTVKTAAPTTAKTKAESTLDEDTSEEEDDIEKEEEDEDKTDKEEVSDVSEGEEEEGFTDERVGGEVLTTDGLEDSTSDDDFSEKAEEKTIKEAASDIINKIKDTTFTAFNKVKDDIIELLFPTGQTLKYKVSDGTFSSKIVEGYESKALKDGDKIILIPFKQSRTSKSSRNFGYAIVTPSIDSDGNVIPDTYKTVSILSDEEIDRFKEKADTRKIYDTISQNESRNKGFVAILYGDVSDKDGFTTNTGKPLSELEEGTVIHANPIKYFYKDEFKDMNQSSMNETITKFIDSFYKNHLEGFPPQERGFERKKLVDFYNNPENARIIIPTNKDVADQNPKLKIPPELRTYVRAGRPYLVFKPYHARSSMQFIALSRKFLSTSKHNEAIEPIRNFIILAKVVRSMLEKKGIDKKLGYSKSLSNMLSKLSYSYLKDPNPQGGAYKVNLVSNENNKVISKEYSFTMAEAERIYNLFSMYSQPNTEVIEAKTVKEIENLTKVKRPRNLTFEDGDTIFGVIESYDQNTKTFVVKDSKTGETSTKSGVISHTGKASVGEAQEAVDNIFNSNSHIASKFISIKGNTGFVTDRNRSGNKNADKGYKFMALLGSKTSPVAKSYNKDNTVKETYADVIDILESLFNFDAKGEIPGKTLKYVEDDTQKDIEVKFRVPVPINARNENGQLEHDYTNSPQNTSRITSTPNSRFFETNFETLLPSRVFIKFGEPSVKEKEEKSEESGQNVQENVQVTPEVPKVDVKTLSKEDILSLSFKEIRDRLTLAQTEALNIWVKLPENDFETIDRFFAEAESSHTEEQELFRDYLIECLL